MDDIVAQVLKSTRRIAVVGASNKPERASYHVMAFLIGRGFEVVPVNPGLAGGTILGRTVVASLAEAGELEMVDLFRNSADVGPPVEEAIRLGAETIWMQLGVVNEEVAATARAAELTVIMDRCPAIEMPRLGL